MKAVLTALASSLIAISALAAPEAADTAARPASPPVSPASAASRPYGATNPAVRAAENARPPGEVRPKTPIVPQLSVPFKGSGDTSTAGPIVPGGVDDGVARCRAAVDADARKACEQKLREQEADAKRGAGH